MTHDDSEFYRSLLRAYIDSANDGIFVICDEMKFHVVNPAMESWLGAKEAKLVEHNKRIPITKLIGNAHYAALFEQEFAKAMAGLPVRFECLITPKGGLPRWLEIGINKVLLEAGDMFIGIARDITERRGMLEEIEYQSTHDYLTGLLNRFAFEKQLIGALNEQHNGEPSHVLLHLGVDNFKVVNDSCGHQAGNLFLQQVAAQLKNRSRRADTLARLGGDEFAILLRNCPIKTALKIAESYRKAIKDSRFHWDGKVYEISASIGVADLDTANTSAIDALGYAEVACRYAKEKGGNRVQLYREGDEATLMRRESKWVGEIQAALHENRFQLHFQQIKALSAETPTQAHGEILLRMLDDQGRLIPPGEFLPAAERFQLMPAIDRWVIEQLFVNHVKQAGQAIIWAINLSGMSLNDDDFPEFLRQQIARHGIDPARLCFEITETVAIENLQRTAEFVRELRGMGCRFALDDFGSGMSSFAYLHALEVDYLKIDGALVVGIAHDKVKYVMVDAIHQIAKAMNIQTIAEFAEDAAIIKTLRKIGVDYAQGFGIHSPVPL